MIEENTTNLEINDILSDNEDDVKEETYENPDIIEKPIIEQPVSVEEKLNDYKNIIEGNRVDKDEKQEDIIVKKIDDEQKAGDTLIINDTKVDDTKIDDTKVNTDVKEINPNITTIIEDKPLDNTSVTNNTPVTDNKLVKDESTNISAVTQIENIIEDDSIKKVGLGKVEEVKVDDKDETMTLDNFITDVQDLLNDKTSILLKFPIFEGSVLIDCLSKYK